MESLARVLRLDDIEADHLMSLGDPRSRVRRAKASGRAERVPARLRDLLAALNMPAFIENRYFDVLAANPCAIAFNPRLEPGNNRLRSLMLDPTERDFHDDWETAVDEFIAAFRRSLGDETDDSRAIELVGELSLASARFRSHDIRQLAGGTAVVSHPSLGALRLHRERMPIDDLILVVYYPAEHSADALDHALQQPQAASPVVKGDLTFASGTVSSSVARGRSRRDRVGPCGPGLEGGDRVGAHQGFLLSEAG